SSRGYENLDHVRSFLTPDESLLHNSYELPGAEHAAGRIHRALNENQSILIHGSGTLDGQFSTALLTRLVREHGGNIDYRIADLSDQYTSELELADQLEAGNVDLFISCGSDLHSIQVLEEIMNRGIEVIVINRGVSASIERSPAHVVDTEQEDSLYLNSAISVTGMAFKVGEILLRKMTGEEPGNFVAVDLETTGTVPRKNEIIEIGAVRYRRGKAIDEFQTMVNSVEEIPLVIRELTGIDNEDLVGAPDAETALRQFLDFIGGEIIVAHNAPFDAAFLHYSMKRHLDKPFLNEYEDTKELAREIMPGLAAHGLKDMCRRLGIDMGSHHRALDDAYSCGEVYVQLLSAESDSLKDYRERYLPFVALATMLEQAQNTPENRALMHLGMKSLETTELKGLEAFVRQFEHDSRERLNLIPESSTLVRIRKASRRDNSTFLVKLCTEEDPSRDFIDELEKLDKSNESEIRLQEQIKQSFDFGNSSGYLLAQLDSAEPILVDTIVSQLALDYNVPLIVLFKNEAGSRMFTARSGGDVDLVELLSGAEAWIDPFRVSGWASMGYMKSDEIEGFQSHLQRKIKQLSGEGVIDVKRYYDGEIRINELFDFDPEDIDRLRPFGPNNAPPRFLLRETEVIEATSGDSSSEVELVQGEDSIRAFYDRAPQVDERMSGVGKVWIELGTRPSSKHHVGINIIEMELH
ncbi:MAG: exonuclease domain-containing protein, partial [bacterium]